MHGIEQRKRQIKAQQGFTALEVLLVMVVAIIIVVIAADRGSKLKGNNDTTTEVSNIATLANNTRALKTSIGYGASTTSLVGSLVAIGGVPSNMAITGSDINNSWGGKVPIASTGTGFTITYNSVPKSNCIIMASQLSQGGMFSKIQVNSATEVSGAYSSAQATTDCSSSAANIIVMTSTS
jgi:Tfp pilus assembly protein FimT